MLREMQNKAMSGDARLEILRLLAEPEKYFTHQKSANPAIDGVCMSLIAEALNVTQPTVTRHVDILRQAGFLSVKKMQKWTYCRREEEAIREYLTWLQDHILLKP